VRLLPGTWKFTCRVMSANWTCTCYGMPGVLKFLGAVGNAAMVWVGGSLWSHGLEAIMCILSVTSSVPLPSASRAAGSVAAAGAMDG